MIDFRVLMHEDGKWVGKHTEAALPILLGRLKGDKPQMTYAELNIAVAKRLGEPAIRYVRAYSMVARKIAQLLNALSDSDSWSQGEIPPLSVLIIRQKDQQPSDLFDPFLSRYIAKINHGTVTKLNRASMVKLATLKVREYKHWDEVASHLGIVM